MSDADIDREEAMKELAAKLLFDVRKHGSRFSLSRQAGLSMPFRSENLTLEEAEALLNTWKLRGFHGG
jgi:hypothetical protein